jgi:aminoglycoside 3-N-acetyltransferase I
MALLKQKMEIRKLEKNEIQAFTSLIEIFKEVFENEKSIPGKDHLSKLLSHPDFLVFVVLLNGQVVGGLTIYVLHQYYSEKPLAYIYDVGISPQHQGKGFGKSLMAWASEFCKQNGFEEAYVEAESDDLDAIHFYQKTNFSLETKATHFSCKFGNPG